MHLEEIIMERITGSDMAQFLCRYDGAPAIFYQDVPGDLDAGWDGAARYPRVVCDIDMCPDKEKGSIGELTVSLYRDSDGVSLKKLKTGMAECMKDVFVCPEGQYPVCFLWVKSDSFFLSDREPGGADNVAGIDLVFHILEYVKQETAEPDPVMAMNRYIKEQNPLAVVIGADHIGKWQETGSGEPAFYCRLESMESALETNTLVWTDCKLVIHVLHPDAGVRNQAVSALANELSLTGRLMLPDGSPMRFLKVSVNHRADSFTDGQISISGHYGLVRNRNKQAELRGVEFV